MANHSLRAQSTIKSCTRCMMAIGLMLAMLLQIVKPLWVESVVSAPILNQYLHAPHWQPADAEQASKWASLEEWEEEWEEDISLQSACLIEATTKTPIAKGVDSNQKRSNLVLRSLGRPLYDLHCSRKTHLTFLAS